LNQTLGKIKSKAGVKVRLTTTAKDIPIAHPIPIDLRIRSLIQRRCHLETSSLRFAPPSFYTSSLKLAPSFYASKRDPGKTEKPLK
jgi:hypothetical protein